MRMIIALLSVACAARAVDAFHPWGLNDSTAFVFPRIAEKRNRGRRERLAAALRNDADAIAAALRFVDWNSLGVAWPRGALRRLPAAFAALVANGRADRAMLEMDHILWLQSQSTIRGGRPRRQLRPNRPPGSPPRRLRRRPGPGSAFG